MRDYGYSSGEFQVILIFLRFWRNNNFSVVEMGGMRGDIDDREDRGGKLWI